MQLCCTVISLKFCLIDCVCVCIVVGSASYPGVHEVRPVHQNTSEQQECHMEWTLNTLLTRHTGAINSDIKVAGPH